MTYQILKLPANEADINDLCSLSLWANPKLLNIFAERDDVVAYYLVIKKKNHDEASYDLNKDTSLNSALMIMPLFEKKKFSIKYIHQPLEYYYTPVLFFLNDKKYDFENMNMKLSLLKELGAYLRKNYLKIKITFDYSLTDVRGFSWAGFRCTPSYTFIKDISSYDRNEVFPKQKRYINKALENNISISTEWNLDVIEELSNSMLNRKNRDKRHISDKYLNFYEKLHNEGLCFMVSAYKDNLPLAFRLLLFDFQSKYLYDFLAGANQQGNSLGANILCLDYLFSNSFCLLNSYYQAFNCFDFCGANTESIAYFKSQFNGRLVHYYNIEKSI